MRVSYLGQHPKLFLNYEYRRSGANYRLDTAAKGCAPQRPLSEQPALVSSCPDVLAVPQEIRIEHGRLAVPYPPADEEDPGVFSVPLCITDDGIDADSETTSVNTITDATRPRPWLSSTGSFQTSRGTIKIIRLADLPDDYTIRVGDVARIDGDDWHVCGIDSGRRLDVGVVIRPVSPAQVLP